MILSRAMDLLVRGAIFGLVFLLSAHGEVQGTGIKLSMEFFQKVAPMGMISRPELYPEWQEVSIGFRETEPVKFYFPARVLVERITAGLPGGKVPNSMVSFDRIEIGLFRSASYFSIIYNVRLTLKDAGGGRKSFIASFRGKRGLEYLRSDKAQQQLCEAIVECLKGIEHTGGFHP